MIWIFRYVLFWNSDINIVTEILALIFWYALSNTKQCQSMLSICPSACQERELNQWLHFFFIRFEFRFIPYAAFVNDYLVQFCIIILNIKSLFFVYLLINNMLFSVVRNVSQYCPFLTIVPVIPILWFFRDFCFWYELT